MVINNELAGFAKALSVSQVLRKSFADEIVEGRYQVKLARTRAEIESALRLRYEVFNVELSAAPNHKTSLGLEFDEYDAGCRHLIIIEKVTNKTIGTYRINSIESAKDARGFYAYNEFSLEDLSPEVLSQAMEVGRACIARQHRNSKVLFLLLKALLNYLKQSQKRYFFGCCSIFTQDSTTGAKVFHQFEREGYLHPKIRVRPRRERALPINKFFAETERIELPSLFNIYLKMGVKICGAPVIDREFGTVDFFVIFDLRAMNEKYKRMFFTP
ncbi:MAG: GNAT family N-acetyltransferase [Acidobacteriota bacterium]|nr:GNAT family N-acetyltransferase [Acidobacteriota bacterium]